VSLNQSDGRGARPESADAGTPAGSDFQALFDTFPSPRLLKAVLDNATVAIFFLDEHQRCAYMNAAAERLTGYTLAETQGRRLHDVIHHTRPDGSPFPLSECPIERAFPENSHRQGEETCVHKDGHFYPVAFSASPIRDAASRTIGMTIELRDITVDKRREAALRDLTEWLETQVAERTRERDDAEDALRHAQKMEAIGQLTGGIAHDFNNLLTGITGSLELMRTRLAQGRLDTLSRYIDAASDSAQRAATLTHRLLAFARRQPLDPKPVDANRLVASMEEMLRRTLGEAIRLEIVTAGELWQTLCDPHQLESGLLNLALNARDAMPHGGTLTIETCNAQLDRADAARERDVEPGQYVCIRLADTGAGMSREVMDRAFEPFFTTKPVGAGTGLGLSVLYGFARQSKGFCKIHSEPGQGTTVRLYLPRLGRVDSREGAARAKDAPRAGPSRMVLVVEDEPVVRALVLDILRDLGHRAMEAEDGPSGLRILQSTEPIDLLITDVGLPGINGRQLADQARERRPDLKVLFMTGYAEGAALASGFLQPGMELMTKPFALDTLAARLRDLLERPVGPPSS